MIPDMYVKVIIPHGRNFDNVYTNHKIFMISLGQYVYLYQGLCDMFIKEGELLHVKISP